MTELDKKISDTRKFLESLEQEKRNKDNDLRLVEFYKRGYCSGTTIKSFISGPLGNTETLRVGGSPKIVNENQIWWEGTIVYKDGIWAQIIEQKPMNIESFKVEVIGGKAFINGNYYGKDELITIANFMKTHANQVKFISCGCNDKNLINVSVETIDSIIKLIENQNLLEENRKKMDLPTKLVVINFNVKSDWWYYYKRDCVFPVRQSVQSDLSNVEILSGHSRNSEDFWIVSDKTSDYYGYLISKVDCRILNISQE